MARIKGATMTHKRRAKTLKLAKGYYGAKSKHFRRAATTLSSAVSRRSASSATCGSPASTTLFVLRV